MRQQANFWVVTWDRLVKDELIVELFVKLLQVGDVLLKTEDIGAELLNASLDYVD